MADSKKGVDATDLEHQIQAYEENISRCEKNIKIFSEEVQKQIQLKAQLMQELAQLKLRSEEKGRKKDISN